MKYLIFLMACLPSLLFAAESKSEFISTCVTATMIRDGGHLDLSNQREVAAFKSVVSKDCRNMADQYCADPKSMLCKVMHGKFQANIDEYDREGTIAVTD